MFPSHSYVGSMPSPFDIQGPALVSFSGGRTSAFMLRKILDHGLRDDVFIVFADTGKERAETYTFVTECAERWGIPIHRVQRPSPDGVTPFEQLITDRGYLPNPTMRMCTQELKIRPMKKFMMERGFEEWTMVVGIRADEPRRVARLRGQQQERWVHRLPLADAGVCEADVLAFWKAQEFDLQLEPHEGNCDLCFLKTLPKRIDIMRRHPEFVAWWTRQEERTGQQFLGASKSRAGEPTYRALLTIVRKAHRLPVFVDEETEGGECLCHD